MSQQTPQVHRRMVQTPILRIGAKLLIPYILLFAFYVQFHGDFGPGGGFQAGVIFAAGLVLYALVFGIDALDQVAPPRILELGMAFGVLLYGGTGVATMLLGQEFLAYDALDHHHGQHWGILLVEGGVGITVTCTMAVLYRTFAIRGRPE